MDEFVPDDILKLIERIETRKGEDYQARKRAKEAERVRLGAIDALRQERKTELKEACWRIDAWIENFNKTAGPSLWQLLGGGSGIVLFVGKFWRGEPAPAGDVACSAQLRLGGPEAGIRDSLVYEELHKGQVSHKLPLLGAHTLWQHVHPDFVMHCDAHLSGPDAWRHIRQRLLQMDKQLTSV